MVTPAALRVRDSSAPTCRVRFSVMQKTSALLAALEAKHEEKKESDRKAFAALEERTAVLAEKMEQLLHVALRPRLLGEHVSGDL